MNYDYGQDRNWNTNIRYGFTVSVTITVIISVSTPLFKKFACYWKLHQYTMLQFTASYVITLNESRKKIFTVESNKATATNLLLGDIFTHKTASSSFSVRVWRSDKTLAFDSLPSSTTNSNCQNLTVLSPPPVAQPLCKENEHL